MARRLLAMIAGLVALCVGLSTALLTPTARAAEPYLTVSLTRTDTLGSPVRAGQTLTFSISYTNLSTQTITAFPRSSNLTGVLTTSSPNCRWGSLAAGATKGCTTATHLVTAADVEAGSFSPSVTFDATTDTAGSNILQAGITATVPAITTAEGDPDDPATIPSERVDGVPLQLASANYLGFTCHRIPALTQAPNGWILAAWDGRPDSCQDSPNPNSIVQRISKDGGKSWSVAKVIAAGQGTVSSTDKFGYSDPSYVVDHTTGKIFAFFVKSFDVSFQNSQLGTDPTNRNVLHAAVMESADNGQTCTTPKVITADITGDGAFRSRFAASGEGIQLRYGAHAGRLIQQYTFASTTLNTYQAVSIYSDDHGVTWEAGTPVGTGMDENKVVELSNGDVMLNSRASDSTFARKVTISTDGGETYGPVRVDNTLIDPRNNAGITRAYPDAAEGSAQAKMLLFTNAASTSARSNGTVRLSYDDGATWSTSKVFAPGFDGLLDHHPTEHPRHLRHPLRRQQLDHPLHADQPRLARRAARLGHRRSPGRRPW